MYTLNKIRRRIRKSVLNVSKTNNYIDIKKEQIILTRLEGRLGKPKEEIKKMLSDELLSLLTLVPFRK